jgi:Flp pilus assembly pilin Flp
MLKKYLQFKKFIGQKLRFEKLRDEEGMATVEYAIVMVAAAGFAGLLIALLKSDFVRDMLQDMIGDALSGTAS